MAENTGEPRHPVGGAPSSLADKVETMEQQVRDTVQGATEAVGDAVAHVKGAVSDSLEAAGGMMNDAVESVQETFDLPLQVRRHPWGMCLGAVAAGYVLGLLLSRSRR